MTGKWYNQAGQSSSITYRRVQTKAMNLTGPWVHNADAVVKPSVDSQGMVVHEGYQVTLLVAYRMDANRNQWQTYRCIGPLQGNRSTSASKSDAEEK